MVIGSVEGLSRVAVEYGLPMLDLKRKSGDEGVADGLFERLIRSFYRL